MAAMTCLSANAQVSGPVVINGSLIDWYYQVAGSNGQMVWCQYPVGGESWIDMYGVEHTATAYRGMMALTLSPGTPMPLHPEFRVRNSMLVGNCGGIYKAGTSITPLTDTPWKSTNGMAKATTSTPRWR